MLARWGRRGLVLALLAAVTVMAGCTSGGRANATYLGGDYHPRHDAGWSSQIGDHGG